MKLGHQVRVKRRKSDGSYVLSPQLYAGSKELPEGTVLRVVSLPQRKESFMSRYTKALAAVATAVVAVAAALGYNIDPAAVATVQGAITALLVFVVPNSQ